jgi:hypothetical protein
MATTVLKEQAGWFGGRTLVQQSGSKGGAKHVFVRFDENYSDLRPFPFGGQVKNPPKGAFRLFAGDLCEYRCDENVEHPEIYILKTYLVKAYDADSKVISIVRDGYKHRPFVGDTLTVCPAKLTDKGEKATVIAIAVTDKTWELTISETLATAPKEGDVMVESDAEGYSVVKNVNAVASYDYTFAYSQSADLTADEIDTEKAQYFITPSTGGTMYTAKMSPLPQAVLDLNIANVTGFFRVDATIKPAVLQVNG